MMTVFAFLSKGVSANWVSLPAEAVVAAVVPSTPAPAKRVSVRKAKASRPVRSAAKSTSVRVITRTHAAGKAVFLTSGHAAAHETAPSLLTFPTVSAAPAPVAQPVVVVFPDFATEDDNGTPRLVRRTRTRVLAKAA